MSEKEHEVRDAEEPQIHVPLGEAAGNPPPVPTEIPLTRRQKWRLVGLVILKRARFILILVAVGMLIVNWDAIKNHWDKWTRPATAELKTLPEGEEFFCPMDPQVVRSTFEPNGSIPNCPICGMPLSTRKVGEKVELPPGVASRVQFSPERVRLAGIRTAEVAYRPLATEIVTVGNVAYDESRLSRIVSRVDGYVEKLFVDKTYMEVEEGEPLAEIYSPDLYSAAQELIIASKRAGTADLAEIARKRLRLLDVSQQEVDAIAASGKAAPKLVIRSPRKGWVIGKEVVNGSRVQAGMTLLEVADLSVVWIEAEVYEKDLPLLRTAEKIEATVESLPGRKFDGKVALVYPRMESATRTVRARFEVANADGQLRPGMYATVRLSGTGGTGVPPVLAKGGTGVSPVLANEHGQDARATQHGQDGRGTRQVLAVPEPAVVDTGTKQIVYVERSPGTFEGVEVQLGPRSGEHYPVLKGLKVGDRVAAAGAFLIDAETRLNPAAAATYFGASGGPSAAAGRPKTTESKPAAVTKPATEAEPAAEAKPAEKPGKKPPFTAKQLENIAKLPAADQPLAKAQKRCPVQNAPLGSMGVPVTIKLKGQKVFLCCAGCTEEATADPEKTLKKVEELKAEK